MGEEEKKQTVDEKKENEEPKKAEEDKKTTTDHVPPISLPENKKPALALVDESKKEEESGAPPPPPPPQEIILKVYMHCEGCARKVRRCLKGFQGVEDVVTDTKAHTVVVKGEKADPLKVLRRIQEKNHRQVELLSPIPPPLPEEEPKIIVNPPPPPPQPQKKEVITVMLKVHMHCEACAQEIRRRIQKMQGVESATADLKTSEVVVKGSFEPPKLIDFIRKRTGKHALIVKVEPEPEPEPEEKAAAKEKEKEKETTTTSEEEEKKKKDTKTGEEGGAGKDTKKDTNDEGEKQAAVELELKKSELLYNNYPQYYHHHQHQHLNHQSLIQHELNAYPPQMFSDENPNSCSVM